MARKTATYRDLLQMAEEYGVSDNALFLSAAANYDKQKKIIDRISDIINSAEVLVSKEYVKDRENLTAHPLLKELPKHIDSANKSLNTMLDIITKLGQKQSPGSKLGAFMNGE